jgi:hypothetical protein
MTDYKTSAHNDVNKYLWSRLTSSGVLTASNYFAAEFGMTLVPIVPIQEVPELANHIDDNPYIVYSVMTTPSDAGNFDEWWFERDELTFAIYAPNVAKLQEITNCIKASFRRQDQTARLIEATPGISGLFYFYSGSIDWAEISGEATQESGRAVAEIQVCYNYSRKTTPDGEYA